MCIDYCLKKRVTFAGKVKFNNQVINKYAWARFYKDMFSNCSFSGVSKRLKERKFMKSLFSLLWLWTKGGGVDSDESQDPSGSTDWDSGVPNEFW